MSLNKSWFTISNSFVHRRLFQFWNICKLRCLAYEPRYMAMTSARAWSAVEVISWQQVVWLYIIKCISFLWVLLFLFNDIYCCHTSFCSFSAPASWLGLIQLFFILVVKLTLKVHTLANLIKCGGTWIMFWSWTIFSTNLFVKWVFKVDWKRVFTLAGYWVGTYCSTYGTNIMNITNLAHLSTKLLILVDMSSVGQTLIIIEVLGNLQIGIYCITNSLTSLWQLLLAFWAISCVLHHWLLSNYRGTCLGVLSQ